MAERIWTLEAKMQYPKKWIVMVNVDWDGTGRNRMVGEIYDIKDSREEALSLRVCGHTESA
jgi:hypothetical protein